jgi:hypothetical protein
MKSLRHLFLFSLMATFLWAPSANAQDDKEADDDLVQFSGMVLTADSLMAIPYVNIYSKRTRTGSYSDLNGYFNFVAHKGDTIVFSCIGFRMSQVVIPDTLHESKYSMVKLMTVDTMYLDEYVITPLPLRDMFDYAFVHAEIPDDDMERARKNLERQKLKEAREEMRPDGAEIGKYQLRENARKYYYAGQIPPNNLLNPFAWAQFVEAWKRGDFKRKTKKNEYTDDLPIPESSN